jgi:hypothetical protein
MDGHILGRLEAKANLALFDFQHCDFKDALDAIGAANHNHFLAFS